MQTQESNRGFTAKVNLGALKMAARFYGRRGKDPSYQDLAEMCGVSKSTIFNVWSGKRKTVNPETAVKIEEGLRVEQGSIFTLTAIGVYTTGNTQRKVAA